MYLIPYNLRIQSQWNHSIASTKKYGIETASSVVPKLRDKIPMEIKNSKSLEEFNVGIKSWVPKNCPCKIYKLLIKHVGSNNEHSFMFHVRLYAC